MGESEERGVTFPQVKLSDRGQAAMVVTAWQTYCALVHALSLH